MTPFGARVRDLRRAHNVSLKRFAADLQISAAYLSALEHGHRGIPSPILVDQVCAYFNIIWDDADELRQLVKVSHPRAIVDTAGLNPKATQLANRLAKRIAHLNENQLDQLLDLVE